MSAIDARPRFPLLSSGVLSFWIETSTLAVLAPMSTQMLPIVRTVVPFPAASRLCVSVSPPAVCRIPVVAAGPSEPPLIGKATVGGGPRLTTVVGGTGASFTANGPSSPGAWGPTFLSFCRAAALSASLASPVAITATVFGCVSLNDPPSTWLPLKGGWLALLAAARLWLLPLPFFLPVKPSFLLSCLAALPVSFSLPTLTLTPKPLRAKVRLETVAIFMVLPATLPFSALWEVSRTRVLTGALFLPALNLIPPLSSRLPRPLVGSIEPPLTGSVTLRPLTLAGLIFNTLIPYFFRRLEKPLLSVTVVVPLATGSLVALANGAKASNATSATTVVTTDSTTPRPRDGWVKSLIRSSVCLPPPAAPMATYGMSIVARLFPASDCTNSSWPQRFRCRLRPCPHILSPWPPKRPIAPSHPSSAPRTSASSPTPGSRSSASTTPRTSLRGWSSASASRASRPSPVASTRGCTATGSGRCASTRASPPPRTPTSATAI